MKTTFVLLSAIAGALAQSTDAEVVSDNPAGARYIARFDNGLFLAGRVLAGSDVFGMGITYHVSLSGLPEETGPFKYHIHEDPVPEGGDCAGTGGHLDPYGRTDDPPCDDDQPETCEVGDLSGKHGELDGSSAEQSLHDLYTSLNPDSVAFIGNRSVVIHNAAGDRVACANFEEIPAEEAVEPSPSQPDDEDETPSETGGDETPSETVTEETPSETAEETTAEETPAVTETPEVDFDDDDECEAEEPETTAETPAASETPEVDFDDEDECEAEEPEPTAEAPVESSTAEAPEEEAPEEEAPAEPTAEPPAETAAPEEEAPADP